MTLPAKRYSKTDLCYLLVDPSTDINNPGEAERISAQTLRRWIRKRKGLLSKLGLTDKEFKNIKVFSVSQAQIIFEELG